MSTLEGILASSLCDDASTIVVEHMISRVEKYMKVIEIKVHDLENVGISYPMNELQLLQTSAEQNLLNLKSKLGSQITIPNMMQPMMQLSKINVPKFDGDATKWTQFHDLYKQLVHEQAMPKAMKMFYLKDNLSGEAEKLIRHLHVSESNYDAAWSIIKEKYDDKRAILDRWLSIIVKQKPISPDSPQSIKTLHDSVREATLAIDSLNIPTRQLWEAMVMYITAQKLDGTTRTLYEQALEKPQAIQPLDAFIRFLGTRYRSLNIQGINSQDKPRGFKSLITAKNQFKAECPICAKDHAVYNCDKFLKERVADRNAMAFKANLCMNCLKRGHFANKCNSRSCAKCGKKHNTLLHPELHNAVKQPAVNISTNLKVETRSETKHVFLATALVDVRGKDGNWVQCRAIIDPGSQTHIASETLRRKLKLDGQSINNGIEGLGEAKIKVTNRLQLKIRSRTSQFMTTIDALVLKRITSNQPQQLVSINDWKIPKQVVLADPRFNEPQQVDLLLGAELYGALILPNQICLNENLPTLQESALGWLIIGAASIKDTSSDPFCGIGTINLDEQIRKFWELEEYLPRTRLTSEELKCENFFDATTIRENGRFMVNIPLQNSPSVLGDSKAMAFRRLLSIERKLGSNPELKKQYVQFMQEYEQLGHMTELTSSATKGPQYFIPHHCVLKPSSSTTKLRVVFDASATTSSNISLNEIMLNGPRIQDEIFAIILRFRTKRYVFTADIKQMYRQIYISPEDRNLQQILWREEPNLPIKVYQLNTVTYGTKSAPYLATKCLQRLAEDEEDKYPKGAKASRDFYVDDIITGADNIEEAVEIQQQLNQMLKTGGFQLRKWCANHPRLLENIPKEDMEIQLDFTQKQDGYTKPLGLVWHPVTDQFQPSVNLKQHEKLTKRTVFSDTAQLFDPLGLVNPVVVRAKIFMQQVWKMKTITWDDELPAELQSKWVDYRNGMAALQDLRIPRLAVGTSERIVLHVFADASERAYGAAVYLRTVTKDDTATVRLLCARSRVAPLKQTKLPLLELCAAKLAAELVKVVVEHISVDDAYYWTDSQIVLSWIHREAATLVTFVANRIADIQAMSKVSKWRYVPSNDNPADILSRGCTAQQLCKEPKWFSGPEFVKGSQRDWPQQPTNNVELIEYNRTLKIALITTMAQPLIEQINHGNSFVRLQRVMAFIIRAARRFKLRVRQSMIRKYQETRPTIEELEDATVQIFKEVQVTEFDTELDSLRRKRMLPKGNSFISLAPFIDAKGLIRVGGRLEASDLSYDAKHPILLPQKHFVSRLFMVWLHVRHLHAGPQALTAISRQRVWIIQGRQLARSVVNSCIRCARTRPKCSTQIMGQLPATRVTSARPFINCGVDFCGPVWTHFKLRGRRPQKTYIAIFCCFATKAVHIEVVSDLSTDGFICALKRFVARRGSCQNIYSDNGRNFVGTRNQFNELQDIVFGSKAMDKISTHCHQRRVQFHFIPPRAPHMGGLWEAVVKSLKHLLHRTVSSAALTYEDLCTVTAEIESVLNSRPITPLSSDPNDLNVLTPGHFLIGEAMTATVDPHACDRQMNLLSRWQLVSFCRTEFWKRWSVEYITNLQQRAKWAKEFPNMMIGTLVVIKEDNMPPLKWSMGRIIDVITGQDGHVRVADVRTASGTIRRAIHLLAPLPVEDTTEPIQPTVDAESNDESRPLSVQNTSAPIQPTIAAESRDEERPSKRRRSRHCNLGTAILTTLLVLLPLAATSDLKGAHIQPLNTNSGLFYDRAGQLKLSPTHWTIMVYFNLSGFGGLSDGIATILGRMQDTAATIHQPGPYQEIILHLDKRFKHGYDRGEILMHGYKRNRRAALNVVGNVFNKLFGVLDEDYANDMRVTIGSIQSNEMQLHQLLKNHTSILDATINVVKRDREDIINHTMHLQRQLKTALAELSNKVSQELIQDRSVEYFNLLSVLVMSYMQEYEEILDNIADVTFGLHQGHTSIHIMSPDQLQTQLDLIKQQIPPTVSLPLSQGSDLQLVYKMMKTQGRIYQGYYLFKIEIPLVLNDHFNLYRLLSVPVMINSTQMSIIPTTDYIAIDLKNNHYYAMSIMELDNCDHPSVDEYICELIRPIEAGYASLHQCESEMMLAKTLPSSCTLTSHYPHNTWSPLVTAGTWLYVVTMPSQITIICNNGIIERGMISDSGIISLAKGCTLRTQNVTLTAYDDLITKIDLSEQPQVNLSALIFPIHDRPKHDHEQSHIPSGLLFHETIRDIADRIKTLQTDQTELRTLQPHDIHQYSVSYTALGLIIIIMLYLTYKTRQSWMKCKPSQNTFTLKSASSERREDVGV